jgi:predicted nucleotidyltransferase
MINVRRACALLPCAVALEEAMTDQTTDAVEALLAAFPNRLRVIYLFGSYAAGTAVPASDLDLFIVFHGTVRAGEHEHARAVGDASSHSLGVGVDVMTIGDSALLQDGHFRIAAAGVPIWGEDLRDRLPPVSLATYLRNYSRAPIDYMRVIRGVDHLDEPVVYPDPDGEFFGYDAQLLYPGNFPAHNVKAMVATACWIGTATIGLRFGRTAASKTEGVALYRALVGGRWGEFVADLYTVVKERWGYLVPPDEFDRRRLRAWCAQLLELENDYLALYRHFRAETGEEKA